MDLRKLRHAVTLSQHLSFTKAAQLLNITQPALSRSIRNLEEECQIKLFDRDRTRVALTQAGREFISHAEAMVRSEANMRSVISHVAHGEGGRITLGVTPVAGRILLTDLLSKRLSHPRFQAAVVIDTERKMLPMILEESLDLCVCTDPQVFTNISLSPLVLAELPLAMLVRQGHPLKQVADLQPEHLQPYPLIRSRPYDLEDDATVIVGPDRSKAPAVTVDDYTVLAGLTINSDALWVTTPLVAKSALASGMLSALSMPWLQRIPTTKLVAYVLKGRTLSPMAEALLNDLVECGRTMHASLTLGSLDTLKKRSRVLS